MNRWLHVTVAAVLASFMACGSAQGQSPSTPPEGLVVTAHVDHPAMWVADRVTYTVDIVCPRGLDILTGDLDRDKLKLTGLEVISAASRRRDEDLGVKRYAFDYVLTTYRVDVATPTIGSFPVRYYLARPGQRPEEAAPAGSVVVPAVPIAFRSLLPDDQTIYDVRDGKTVPPRWLPYGALVPVGLGMVLLAAAPAAFVAMRLTQAARARRTAVGRSSRQSRKSARAALEDLRLTDAGTPDARRDAFAKLDGIVRQHVGDICGVGGEGLTPDEIALTLKPCAAKVPIELVASVLAACELARYANAELQPSADGWRQALADTEQILLTR